MRTFWSKLMSSAGSLSAATSGALLLVVALCLGAYPAMAITQPPPIVVTGPTVVIGDAQFGGANGGWPGGQAPLGGTFVVGPNGDVIVGDGYGGNSSSGVFMITPAGVQSVLANFTNSDAAGIDKYGNVYIARDYGPSIIKLPYNATTGTYAGFTTLPTANCQGGTQDTAACVFAPGTQALFASENAGFSSLFFDAAGNFFFSTDTNPANNPDTIYECSAQCQAETDGNGTHPAVVVYADKSGGLGSVAIDPWGNLFFSDGADNGANTGKVSYLQELPFSGGHFAASPTQITSYTTTAGYNAITGVSANSLNTVFFSVPNDGVFALPNSSSGPNPAGIYKVSGQGGQGIAVDSIGNLYTIGYVGSLSRGGVTKTLLNNLSFGSSPVGTAATAVTATALDNAGNCTTPPTLAFKSSVGGVSTTEFATVAGTTCSTAVGTGNGTFSPALASTGASYSVAITFTPAAVGARDAALVITDSANSASGTSALSGVGQGILANLDPGVWTSYTSGFTKPYSVSVDGSGDMAVADSGGGVYWIPAGSASGTKPTLITASSTIGEPAASAFDPVGNLYVADFKNNEIVEFAAPVTASSASSIVVPSTAIFGGAALSSPSGLAFGPEGTLYISDLANSRVVSWNPDTGQSGVVITGLSFPWGLAVDSSGNIYVANTGGGNLVENSNGIITESAVTGVTAPWGVAVDPSGSLIVSDQASGNMVWVPSVSGALDYTGGVLIEKNPDSALAIALDSNGNLYTPDGTGAAVYAINRSAAALNFGTVQNGISSATEDIYVEVTGNEPATFGTPAFAAPSNTDFTLTSTVAPKCTGGGAGSPGQYCILQSVFTPAVGTTAGSVTGTSTLSSNASNASSAPISLSGTATASAILPQTITGFTPPSSIEAGQQIALSATGGASGNPVIFSIDPSSACLTCATISGNTLTAVSAGSVKVDANQASGTANGNQYAAAQQVQAAITINNNVVAADVPALTMNQINWSYQTGSFTDGQNPAGGSFAVTKNGLVYVGTTYSNKTDIVNQSTGALVSQISMNGGGVFTIDSNNNLYMGHLYNSAVYKIPFVNGAYVTLSDLSSAPNCTGTDTAICQVGTNPSGGTKAIAFDASGNLYMVSVPGGIGVNAIYECAAACQTGGAATLVYSDTTGAVSQVAADPWGNLFFTDGVYGNAGNFGNDEVTSSNLWELPYTAGTGFAATPKLLQTLTDSSPADYDNQLDGVAVTSTGTIYYADQNDGTFAIPNSQAGGPDTAHQYLVSALGAKGMELDANGNEWVVVYHSGGDNLGEALLGDLSAPTAQFDGPAVTTTATVVDNAFSCTKTATLEFASTNAEFSASAAGAKCSTVSANFTTPVSGATYPATISFAATDGGPQTATFTITDSTNGGEGTATVAGIGQETPQTLTFTAPTTTTVTYAPGMTINVSVTNGGSNNPVTFSVDASSSGTGTFSATTVTGTTSSAVLNVTQAGTIVIDANELGGLVGGVFYNVATQAQLPLTISPAAQTVVFPQPLSPVTYSSTLTVSLSANGGASGNPVAFTVDPSSTGAGTISASTLSGGTSTATLTVTQAGNIVIDANQAANADYAAATQVQQTIVVNQASQTISFVALTQPFHYIVTGAAVSIQATGGGSDQAIVFTVDKSSTMTGAFSTSTVSGATSTTTLTLPANEASTSGTIVVDATQPGNSNYAAATVTQEIINVLAPLPVQSITLSVPQTQTGSTTLTLTGTASSGFPITYTSSTMSVCTVSGSTITFLAVTSASTCTITASQSGDNQFFAAAVPVTVSFTVNPPGQTAVMKLSLSLPSITIEPGTVGLSQVTLTSQNNFTGMVTFSCGSLPSGYSCSFNPNPINLLEDGSTTTTLTVTPGTSTATAAVHNNFKPLFPATLAVALCFMGFRKRRKLHMLLVLVAFLAGVGFVSGCGGSSSSTKSKPVTSQINVTATSGSTSTSATLTVILE